MADDQNPNIEYAAPDKQNNCSPGEADSLEREDMSDMIASNLREMSEHAFHAGLDNSSCLIEAAALVVEMEGRKSKRG